jgi:hypothetical protein
MLKQILALVGFMLSFSANAATTTFTNEATFLAATGSADVVAGFDLGAGAVDTQYAGLDFDALGTSPQPSASNFTPYAGSGSLLVSQGIGHAGGGFDLAIDGGASAISMQVGGLQSAESYGVTSLELFGLGGATLSLVSLNSVLPVDASGYSFFGVSSSEAIGSVRLTGGSGDFIWFDNISVVSTVSPVPLPAAAWLFISALGGLVVAKRKKLKA